ncbi:MAG: DUF481 domain-containing protein [Desulfuromonadaceae bacterium]|nr:DUF481 domain-containing protein [Desulfuromonadaceae bacterium]
MKTIALKFITVALFFLLLPQPSFAGEEAPPAPANWWVKSALDPTAQYEGVLLKADLSFTYNKLTGNTAGYARGINSGVILRSGQFTGQASHERNDKDITQGADRVESEKWTTVVTGQFDLCRHGYVGAGHIWELDTNNNIVLRKIFIAGVGSYVLSSEKANVNVFLAAGQTDEEYDAIVQRYTSLVRRNYNMLYFYQTFDWQITEWLGLSQGFRLIRSFSKMNEFDMQGDTSATFVSGKSERNLIQATVELQIPVRKYLNIFTTYRYNYDSHPWPGNKSADTLTTTGIRFSY